MRHLHWLAPLQRHATVAQQHLSDRDAVEQIDADLNSLAVDRRRERAHHGIDAGDHHAEQLI